MARGQKHNTHLYSSSEAKLKSHRYAGRLTEADLLSWVLPWSRRSVISSYRKALIDSLPEDKSTIHAQALDFLN